MALSFESQANDPDRRFIALRIPFSCKTRFCPSCGKVRVDNWVYDIARDLYDVPHLHVTLTSDDLLWPHFHIHRSLLKVLLKTAAQACPERSRRAVRELVKDLYPGGRDLGIKPHVHLVMTKGGLRDGQWVESDRLPGNRLSSRWRYLLCKHLRLARPFDRPWLAYADERASLTRRVLQHALANV